MARKFVRLRVVMVGALVVAALWCAEFRAEATAPAEARQDGLMLTVTAGMDLQAALDQARPGDTLLLEAGATFTGNFTLANTINGGQITIQSAATDANLPRGARVTPAQSALMPKIVSPNTEAALRTKAGAHGYRIVGIEFSIASSVMLNYGIVKLGEGNEASEDLLPYDITIDRCYIHGNPLADVTRGIALNGKSATIIDSYVSEIHGLGFDTQAIAGWNGPGPFKIVNNYLEGAGENVMFGGADPKIAGLVPADIEFRRNYLSKPLAWRDGILQKPANLSATPISSASGFLSGGTTYYYRVAARVRAGYSVTATSAASDEIAVILQPNENLAQLTWAGVERATKYRVYRTADGPGAPSRRWVYYEVEAGGGGTPESAAVFTDAGAAGTAIEGEPPTSGTRWSVKNIFELKNARRVLIEGNIFEHNWADAQSGFAILFTVRNQDGSAPWCVIENVTFTNNIVRHVAAAINLLGKDTNYVSGQARSIKITNNLFFDVNSKPWGGNGVFLLVTDVVNLTVSHNTVLQSGNIISAWGLPTRGFKFVNNILMHNDYGVMGDGTSPGNSTLDRYFEEKKFKRNALVGGQQSQYPGSNIFLASLAAVGFADPAAGIYDLAPNSPLKLMGTDGRDLGCDMEQLRAALGL